MVEVGVEKLTKGKNGLVYVTISHPKSTNKPTFISFPEHADFWRLEFSKNPVLDFERLPEDVKKAHNDEMDSIGERHLRLQAAAKDAKQLKLT